MKTSSKAIVEGHHRVDALEILVVAVAHFDSGSRRRRMQTVLARVCGKPRLVQPLQIAAHSLRTEGHRAVDPCANFRAAVAFQVAGEAGRNLEDELQLAAAHARFQLGVVADGRTFAECQAVQMQPSMPTESCAWARLAG